LLLLREAILLELGIAADIGIDCMSINIVNSIASEIILFLEDILFLYFNRYQTRNRVLEYKYYLN
jgi:hypothetical protein